MPIRHELNAPDAGYRLTSCAEFLTGYSVAEKERYCFAGRDVAKNEVEHPAFAVYGAVEVFTLPLQHHEALHYPIGRVGSRYGRLWWFTCL